MKIKGEVEHSDMISQDGMTIIRLVKEEKVKTNKEVWITLAKSKTETLAKLDTQENNIVDADQAADTEMVTADNLGLVCGLCQKLEKTDHELLTHHC